MKTLSTVLGVFSGLLMASGFGLVTTRQMFVDMGLPTDQHLAVGLALLFMSIVIYEVA